MSDTKRQSLSHLVPTRTEVEAAKLWIIIDRRSGQETPEWVLRVAEGLPPVAPSSKRN